MPRERLHHIAELRIHFRVFRSVNCISTTIIGQWLVDSAVCLTGVVAAVFHRDFQGGTLAQVTFLRLVQQIHFALILREDVHLFPLRL